jgi:hypothetical protein
MQSTLRAAAASPFPSFLPFSRWNSFSGDSQHKRGKEVHGGDIVKRKQIENLLLLLVLTQSVCVLHYLPTCSIFKEKKLLSKNHRKHQNIKEEKKYKVG